MGDQREAVHVPGDESGSGLAEGHEVFFIGEKRCGRAPRDRVIQEARRCCLPGSPRGLHGEGRPLEPR
eukprot:10421751-Heterocapsa_arctica.AAC.1